MNYKRICELLIEKGINIIDINNTYIDEEVVIESGTTIYPNVSIRGKSYIGKNNIIDMNTIIINSKIGTNNHIISSYISDSTIGNENIIGPFANIRENSNIHNKVLIGNFVEVKNSDINDETYSKHLSYIGDSFIGNNVNIGAGTIFANFNSITKEKNSSTVEDNVSIGANAVLISPVTLKKSSIVAAGSVITEDVEEYALGIARNRQINKQNYNKNA